MNARAAIHSLARGMQAAIFAAGALILAGTLALPAAEPEVPAQRPRLALFATVIGNRNAVAMFKEQSSGRTVSLRVGDVYEGWRLRLIETGKATFENEGQKANYAVTEKAPGQLSLPYVPPPAPAAAAAPTQGDKSQSTPAREAGAPPPQDDAAAFKANQPASDDPVADWFRRQRR
jgi:hypothetical protein